MILEGPVRKKLTEMSWEVALIRTSSITDADLGSFLCFNFSTYKTGPMLSKYLIIINIVHIMYASYSIRFYEWTGHCWRPKQDLISVLISLRYLDKLFE